MFSYKKSVYILFIIWSINKLDAHPKNLAWSGGPLHCECEHGIDLWTHAGKYIKDNVIAIKAVSFNDDIYVITPRLKRGVLATLWRVIRGRKGVELEAFPSMSAHKQGDCDALQNAVDFHLDHLVEREQIVKAMRAYFFSDDVGAVSPKASFTASSVLSSRSGRGNLWILDSGIVETMDYPRCTCPPKAMVINVILKKITKSIQLSSIVDATSQLQNIVVEYSIGGTAFVYISDASNGAILVINVSSGDVWSVAACAPANGIQLALVKRDPFHNSLMIIRIHFSGILELDTAILKRKMCNSPLTVIGENNKPVFLLGFNSYHLYLRHAECADVLSWDIRKPYTSSNLVNIHSAGPHMMPTSVFSDPLKYVLLILDSNYPETAHEQQATYHKLTFIGQI
ncbi:uncharacterized protein [Battus philenor]|uniref:uncharacterized protein n=1 Tax=Battus philenor TaxID=42288 RepID=UPI0035CF1F17